MSHIYFATDDARHEVVIGSHRIRAIEPHPGSDDHVNIVIDDGRVFVVRETLASAAVKCESHGVRLGPKPQMPSDRLPGSPPSADVQKSEPSEPAADDQPAPAANQRRPRRKPTKQDDATPSSEPAGDDVANQPAAGTE